MPGYHEPLEQFWHWLRSDAIELIVCLVGIREIQTKSPSYAAAIEAKTVPCAIEFFPIPDFWVPGDREAFWLLASKLAMQLKMGGRVLIHCGAGIGRTGTLATCVLLALGEAKAKAEEAIGTAGSHPETPEQRELVSWCAAQAQSSK
jgi:protein-tyrosine phosphatase